MVTSRPLRGRDAELARITSRLDGGDARAFLVEGAAGIGKTALLDAFRAAARARDVVVAVAEGDAATPLGTLRRALNATAPASAAIAAALSALVSTGPLAVVIDDAAEADDASLHAIRSLLAGPPVLWLLAARPGSSPAYRRLRSDAELILLRPLGAEHRAEVARDILGADPDADVAALLPLTGGQVADLVDVLDGGLRAGALAVSGGRAGLDPRTGPRFVADTVAPGLAALSPGARRLLDIAAVLGPTFRIADLSALLGAPASRITAEIRELCGAGLIGDGSDGELVFGLDLARAAVLDRLPEAAHRAINRDIALHMVAGGAAAEDVAPYVLGGCRPADRSSGPLASGPLAEVVDRVTAVLPVAAHVRALELAVAGSRQWMALVAPAVRALAYGGRLPEADTVAARALTADPSAAQEVELRLAVAEIGWLRGRDAGQAEALDRLLRRPDLPAAIAARIRPVAGPRLIAGAEPADVLAAADTAAPAPPLRRDHRTLCTVRLAGSEALLRLGRMGDAVRYATESAALSRRIAGGTTVEPRIWLARALSGTDRLDEAQGYCEDVLCEIAEHGNVAMLPGAHAVRARVLLVRGQLGDAATEAQAGVVAAEATGVTQASAELLAMLAFVAAVRGDDEMAAQAADRCAGLVADGIADGGHLDLVRATTSLSGCRALVDTLGAGLGPLVADPGIAPLLARTLLLADDRRRARIILDAATRLAALNPRVPGWGASRLHVTGLIGGDSGAMREAARRFTGVGRHFAAAMALADAALAGSRRGDPNAGPWLDESSRALRAMGATAVVADLSRRGAAVSGSGSRRGDRTAFGWNSLTGAELRVVTLAATGASNKEIARQLWLSPHTVGTHVRHALDKLGLRSRVEMARQAGERGIGPAAGGTRQLTLAYEPPPAL
jgi:DNA-binding CsgD family transcriptional regulator